MDMSTTINIPTSILRNVTGSRDRIGVIFTYYSDSTLFPLNVTDRVIATSVIGARVSTESANSNLTENVTVRFQLVTPVSLIFFFLYYCYIVIVLFQTPEIVCVSWRFADGGKPLAIDEINQLTTWMVLKVCGLMKDVLLNLINLK